jgi:hypothetical protein
MDVGAYLHEFWKKMDALYNAARKIRCAMVTNTRVFFGIRRIDAIGPLLLVNRMEIREALPIEGSDVSII